MPTYEYFCDNCDYEFELFQSIKAESFSDCPKCNKKLERKISLPAGLVFKGSGFYITDYKKNGNGGASSAKSNSNTGETKTAAETTAKTETTKTGTTNTESAAKSVSKPETKTVNA